MKKTIETTQSFPQSSHQLRCIIPRVRRSCLGIVLGENLRRVNGIDKSCCPGRNSIIQTTSALIKIAGSRLDKTSVQRNKTLTLAFATVSRVFLSSFAARYLLGNMPTELAGLGLPRRAAWEMSFETKGRFQATDVQESRSELVDGYLVPIQLGVFRCYRGLQNYVGQKQKKKNKAPFP